MNSLVVQQFKDYIKDGTLNLKLIEKINGISTDRISVFENYKYGSKETIKSYLFELKSDKQSVYLILDKYSDSEHNYLLFESEEEMYQCINERKHLCIDIEEEFKYFNRSLEDFKNSNFIKKLNVNTKLIYDDIEENYHFKVMLNNESIGNFSNIYNFDFNKHLNDYIS